MVVDFEDFGIKIRKLGHRPPEGNKDRVSLTSEPNNTCAELYSFGCVLDLKYASLWRPSHTVRVVDVLIHYSDEDALQKKAHKMPVTEMLQIPGDTPQCVVASLEGIRPQLQYVPRREDIVIGVVTAAFAEGYRVDIRGGREGHLGITAFPNATRQNRPELGAGSIVLCGISHAHKDYDVVLTCISSDDTKGFSTGETYLGELKDGFHFDIPVHIVPILLHEDCALLYLIGQKKACEIVVGHNGRVWIDAQTPVDVIQVVSCIKKVINCSNFTSLEEMVDLCMTTDNPVLDISDGE